MTEIPAPWSDFASLNRLSLTKAGKSSFIRISPIRVRFPPLGVLLQYINFTIVKRHYLLLFLPPLLFATCLRPSDDDMDMNTVNDELPPITMEGAQTFGCLVNGVVFVNRPGLFSDNISMSYNEPASNFDLTARSSSPENQTVDQKFIFMNATFSDIGEASFNDAGYEEEGACMFLPSRQDIPLDERAQL